MASEWDGDLDDLTAKLVTESGYLNAMANIFERLASGELTRDETSGLIGARRCLESFRDAREGRLRTKQHDELVRELQATREAMRDKGGGTVGVSPSQDRLPSRKGKGATEK